jgi:hypothetical protein
MRRVGSIKYRGYKRAALTFEVETTRTNSSLLIINTNYKPNQIAKYKLRLNN